MKNKGAKKAVILLGNSGAGKDTVAAILGYPNIKITKALKAFLEKVGSLPSGSLDSDRTVRHRPSPFFGRTWLDLMITHYHVTKYIKWIYYPYLISQIKAAGGDTVVLTDVRDVATAKFIHWWLGAANVLVVKIVRVSSTGLSSDTELDKVFGSSGNCLVLRNEGSLAELTETVKRDIPWALSTLDVF